MTDPDPDMEHYPVLKLLSQLPHGVIITQGGGGGNVPLGSIVMDGSDMMNLTSSNSPCVLQCTYRAQRIL